MNFGIDYMKDNQVSTITLEVRPSNKKAQELYRKLGFNKVAIRRNYYKDNEDAFLLLKDL